MNFDSGRWIKRLPGSHKFSICLNYCSKMHYSSTEILYGYNNKKEFMTNLKRVYKAPTKQAVREALSNIIRRKME